MAKGSTRRRRAETPEMDGNVGRATFLECFDDVKEKLRLKKEADSALANSYKRAENAGIDRKILKKALHDAELSAEERVINDRRYRLYLDWLGKPLGTQADIFETETAAEPVANGHDTAAEAEAVAKHQNNEAYEAGVAAGKAGADMASCPYQPGTEEHQVFSTGWSAGQAAAVAALG